MNFIEIKENKKKYLDLLLLADEQESMVDRYLDKGTMFVLDDNGVKASIVVTEENGELEIKNLAVYPKHQKQGYGKKLIEFITEKYKEMYNCVVVGTGDSTLTLPFYEKCGFKKYKILKNFFTENYDHPIIEDGIQLIDMIYLKKEL